MKCDAQNDRFEKVTVATASSIIGGKIPNLPLVRESQQVYQSLCRGGTDPKTVKYMDLIYKFKVKSFKIVTI